METKNMKLCDEQNSHIIMVDTLMLGPSLHFTTLHPTTLHATSLHLLTLHFVQFKLRPVSLRYLLIWLNPT